MAITYPEGDRLYEGAVLATRERNYLYDSDFYAMVWDGSRVIEVGYATTRYGGGGDAQVDATPEVRAAADEWVVRWAAHTMRVIEGQRATDVCHKGREVVVTGGRKHKGKTGTVVAVSERRSAYGTWTTSTRVRVQPADGEAFWVDERWCEVSDPWDYITPDPAVFLAAAEQYRGCYAIESMVLSQIGGMLVLA